jgi:predicted Zn-dependent protease
LIKRSSLLLFSALLLLLAGCASVTTPPPAQVTKSDAIPENAVPQVTAPQAEIPRVETPQGPAPQVELPLSSGAGTITGPMPEPVVSGNPAVIALLDRARLDDQAGKREAAGASLERALRIEPRNPWLWQELAQLRLAQGQYAQGISLARKSISFAGQERHLQALNWRVIGNARVALGNPSDAEQAFNFAAELEHAAQATEPAQAAKLVQ